VDRSSPGWRLDDLEAARAVIPDNENSAPRILASDQLIRMDSIPDGLEEMIADQARNRLFSAPQMSRIDACLQGLQPALSEARKISELPRGRFANTYAKDAFSTPSPHMKKIRQVMSALRIDATGRAQTEDVDGSLASCRALVNAGRSMLDEPIPISQLVRLACDNVVIPCLERALGQGEPSDVAVAATQRLFEDEAGQPILLIMCRAERAEAHHYMTLLQNGDLKPDGFYRELPENERPASTSIADIRKSHAALLRHLTRFVEIAQLPPHEQLQQIKTSLAAIAQAPPLARAMAVGGDTMVLACHRGRARLVCAATALACERYRKANGKWPDSLQALVPTQLSAVPLDPYDGKPLRLIRNNEGITVYSVGPDLQDNQGAFDDHDPTRAGTDLVFRLWYVAKRRQQ